MNKIDFISLTSDSYRANEAFKALRTNLQFSGPDIKCIALTSCLPSEGKSLISLELARSLSEIGKRVIMIDTDMRRSVITLKYKTSVTPALGLSQYLTDQATLDDVVFETQYSGLRVILAGKYPPNPVELLYTEKFSELLARCRAEYDYVILDTPPLGVVTDAAVIAPKCDGAVMLISAGKVKYSMAAGVKAQLENAGCRILGTILNYTDSKRSDDAGYKYGYYRHEEKKKLGFLRTKGSKK